MLLSHIPSHGIPESVLGVSEAQLCVPRRNMTFTSIYSAGVSPTSRKCLGDTSKSNKLAHGWRNLTPVTGTDWLDRNFGVF